MFLIFSVLRAFFNEQIFMIIKPKVVIVFTVFVSFFFQYYIKKPSSKPPSGQRNIITTWLQNTNRFFKAIVPVYIVTILILWINEDNEHDERYFSSFNNGSNNPFLISINHGHIAVARSVFLCFAFCIMKLKSYLTVARNIVHEGTQTDFNYTFLDKDVNDTSASSTLVEITDANINSVCTTTNENDTMDHSTLDNTFTTNKITSNHDNTATTTTITFTEKTKIKTITTTRTIITPIDTMEATDNAATITDITIAANNTIKDVTINKPNSAILTTSNNKNVSTPASNDNSVTTINYNNLHNTITTTHPDNCIIFSSESMGNKVSSARRIEKLPYDHPYFSIHKQYSSTSSIEQQKCQSTDNFQPNYESNPSSSTSNISLYDQGNHLFNTTSRDEVPSDWDNFSENCHNIASSSRSLHNTQSEVDDTLNKEQNYTKLHKPLIGKPRDLISNGINWRSNWVTDGTTKNDENEAVYTSKPTKRFSQEKYKVIIPQLMAKPGDIIINGMNWGPEWETNKTIKADQNNESTDTNFDIATTTTTRKIHKGFNEDWATPKWDQILAAKKNKTQSTERKSLALFQILGQTITTKDDIPVTWKSLAKSIIINNPFNETNNDDQSTADFFSNIESVTAPTATQSVTTSLNNLELEGASPQWSSPEPRPPRPTRTTDRTNTVSDQNNEEPGKISRLKRLKKRCRNWPYCKDLTKCGGFSHPDTSCRHGPNCRRKRNCAFIHHPQDTERVKIWKILH